MARPAHLPDYKKPPLHEVVMGVQFAPPKDYQQIYAGEVWGLFKDKFPEVEEHTALHPTFESFGTPQRDLMNFGFITGAVHDRFWFLSAQKEQLIQFQNDRFLHNWRRVGDGENEYPRFDSIIDNFVAELSALEKYFSKFSKESLNINQCELTYINHMPFKEGDSADRWIRLLKLEGLDSESLSFSSREIVKDSSGKPYARLYLEIGKGLNKKNEQIIVMNITVRGIPQKNTKESAIDFLKNGRELIVNCFDRVTTSDAHKLWEKK
jgi:uncharacterized protein (TIGR04255 family)